MSRKQLSYKVADSLYLVRHTIADDAKATATPVALPTDHVIITDCSGSMWNELPKVHDHLKKKVKTMLKEGDTLSHIWFSGRGQTDVLFEAEPVATLADLSTIHSAYDRWLKPIGLTGFKEPLEKAVGVVERLRKKRSNSVISVVFMSDGMDNCWPRPEILKVLEKLAKTVNEVTIVEYGFYADRNFLSSMATTSGGVHLFAQEFNQYQTAFEGVLGKKVSGAKRIDEKIAGDPIGGFCFAMVDNDFVTFNTTGGTASVPENLKEIVYLSPRPIGVEDGDLVKLSKLASTGTPANAALDAAYGAVSLFAVRMNPDVVLPCLKALGDVRFIESFATCFGKQKYSDFMESAKTAAFGKGRFEQGWDPKRVPRDDAFTVLQLMFLLSNDDQNRVLFEHPSFKYARIGRAREDATAQLSDTELEEIKFLTDKIAKEKNAAKVKEFNDRIAAITAAKAAAILKPVVDPAPDGYPISSLTFNEDRPNISFLVRKTATVDLSARMKPEYKGKVPEKFPTFLFRNYAVVKDGLVNIDALPVRITKPTWDTLHKEEVLAESWKGGDAPDATHEVVLDLRKLPVINRKMIKAVSAKSFFETEFELVKAQAVQKVFNSVKKEMIPGRKSEGYAAQYGEEIAGWLKELGLTDFTGFQPPKTTQAEASDFYMGKELKVSLKGFSSLPSLKEAKGKKTASAVLMHPSIKEVDDFLASDAYTKASDKDTVLGQWLDRKAGEAKQKCRKLIYDIAQTTFGLIVGQVWFKEFNSLEENTMTITCDGQSIDCKAEMREIEIKI